MAPLWETTAPFALFMCATVIAAWYGGIGPAPLTYGRLVTRAGALILRALARS